MTAGHCTYAVGTGAWPRRTRSTAAPTSGSPSRRSPTTPSCRRARPSTATRTTSATTAWSAALDASPTWFQTESTFTHPEYVDAAFLLHDVAVVELSEPVRVDGDDADTLNDDALTEYATLPEANHLDTYYSKAAKQRGLFESVGYGLEGSSPKSSFGGDTRRKADRRLVELQGRVRLQEHLGDVQPRRPRHDRGHLLRRLRRTDVRHLDPRAGRGEPHRRGHVVRHELQLQRGAGATASTSPTTSRSSRTRRAPTTRPDPHPQASCTHVPSIQVDRTRAAPISALPEGVAVQHDEVGDGAGDDPPGVVAVVHPAPTRSCRRRRPPRPGVPAPGRNGSVPAGAGSPYDVRCTAVWMAASGSGC